MESGRIVVVDYDESWPRRFDSEAEQIRAALGDRVLLLEHAGSTAVPGLAAKPVIDIVLAVADSANEAGYGEALKHAGYRLLIREPEWFGHRMFKGPGEDVNLHVFTNGCAEVGRMLAFRDWLRRNGSDRALYEQTKRTLARREFKNTQEYADAKGAVVEEILTRAFRAADQQP